MKICFPVDSFQGMKSTITHHFGAAPCFITYETDTQEAGLIYAQDLQTTGSCNPSVELANLGVDVVVTGGIGPGALQKLMDNGVHVMQAKSGIVETDLENYTKGCLTVYGYDEGKCDCNS